MADRNHLEGWDELNEDLSRLLVEALDRLTEPQDRERFLDEIGQALAPVIADSAERIVRDLFRTAGPMLDEYGALDAENVDEINRLWGDALDVYRMAWVVSHEVGESFSARHFNVPGYEPPPMIHAQLGLQARACRVGAEVSVLLRNGLGAGALARARTLHEIAVTSSALAQLGTPGGRHPDLPARYLDHADVVTYMDASDYQEAAPKIGYPQFSDREMAEMKATRDRAVGKYGLQFGRPNGWAAVLTEKKTAPTFKDLEKLAEADHLRSHYAWASHEVHADAKSWHLNHETIGGVMFRSTGPSPLGLADAAHLALASLLQVTTNMLYSVPDSDERPADVIVVAVLTKLVDRAGEVFASADTKARAQAEHGFRKEDNSRGTHRA